VLNYIPAFFFEGSLEFKLDGPGGAASVRLGPVDARATLVVPFVGDWGVVLIGRQYVVG
jgi:hypothetical protein